ncbi:unnamed protein product, partial [Mesorhabditis spiculigera]
MPIMAAAASFALVCAVYGQPLSASDSGSSHDQVLRTVHLEDCPSEIEKSGNYIVPPQPNAPNGAAYEPTCQTRIRVPEGHVVKIHFPDKDFYCRAYRPLQGLKGPGSSLIGLYLRLGIDSTEIFSRGIAERGEGELFNMCTNPEDQAILHAGHHELFHIRHPTRPFQVRVKFVRTTLQCGGRVGLDQLDLPLMVVNNAPSKKDWLGRQTCLLYLPGMIHLVVMAGAKDAGPLGECNTQLIFQQGNHVKKLRRQTRMCYPETTNQKLQITCNAGSMRMLSMTGTTAEFMLTTQPQDGIDSKEFKLVECK